MERPVAALVALSLCLAMPAPAFAHGGLGYIDEAVPIVVLIPLLLAGWWLYRVVRRFEEGPRG